MKAVGIVFAVLLAAAVGGIGCELVVQVDTNQIPLPTKSDAATSTDAADSGFDIADGQSGGGGDAGTDTPIDTPDDAPAVTPDTADD